MARLARIVVLGRPRARRAPGRKRKIIIEYEPRLL
jgi:hypothetical protein